jgi:hypothetical protein
MGILDRFKTQPKWKSEDPSVRAAGVHEIPEDEQDLLASIARDDGDPRVRKAAVSKLGTVAVLAETLRGDADEGVRDEAAGVLLDIALGAFEAEEPASLAALDALAALPGPAAQKQLVLVAKTAKRDGVSRAALARLNGDQKALGSIARRAEHETVRLEALAALADPAELVSTALRSSFRDVALGALDRLATDRAAVKSIATRGTNQAASRKARTILRAMEEADAAAAAAEVARQQAALQARRELAHLVHDIEAVAQASSVAGADARLDRLIAQWNDSAAHADAGLADRYATAVSAARDAFARVRAAREAADRAADALEASFGVRRVLIARLQGLTAVSPVEAQAAIIAEWNTLDTVDHPAARELNARFDAAARDADKRRDDLSSAADRLRQLNDLATALDAVVADERYPSARELRQRARRLRQDWTAAAQALAESPDAADTLARGRAADAALAERETRWRDQRVAESDEQRRKSLQAIQRLGDLGRVENPTLKSLDRAIADAIAAETALEASTQDEGRDELLGKLRAARTELQPKALALREADDWQRWANANVQERLVGEMEALAKDADASQAARRMRELSAEWKTVAAAPRERAEGLWRRFRAAADAVRAHIEPALAQQSAAQADHLTKKISLCEQAEALSSSTDWITTATTLKNLQAEWKTIGPAPRREEQAVWERFRAACNAFFTRRQDDLKQRKEVWGGNLEKKEALIARAEALGDSPDPDAAFQELKSLQAQWKAIGPVKKSKSEHVWQKFRAASEKIFDRYRNRDAAAVSDRVSRRTVLCDELEALAAKGDALASETGLLEKVRSLRTGWQQAGTMPRDAGRALSERFDRALGAVVTAVPDAFKHTELDVPGNTRQLELLCERVEKLAAKTAAATQPAESPLTVLAHQLREALAANTIGGRADDESKWKSAEYEARAAQDAWRQIGFVPEETAAALTARFQKASQRFFNSRRGPSGPGGPKGPRRP